MPAPPSRVLILGLDGGTMRVFTPAFDRGWMPNLARLWRDSATGVLRSSAPMVTPVAWTSFLTGCTPPVHGIHEFYRLDPETRSIDPNHAGRIRVPTLYHVLSAHDRPVVSLNLPMTYPAPTVEGLVVAGTDAPGRDHAFAQCPDFGALIRDQLPDYPHKITWKHRPSRLDELQALAARTCRAFAALADAALLADARTDWAALVVHFHDLDSLQHRLWPYLQVDDTATDLPSWNQPVIACLRALDDAVGRLLELASRRDAAVMAVSDHGFGPCRALVDVNGILRRAGLQRGLAYGTRFRYRFHRVADRLSRWRNRHDPASAAQRASRSLEGSVGCDWSKTVAFAPFGQLSACVFLTPDIKAQSASAERTIGEVVHLLRGTRHPQTGELLFADVFDVADRYAIDPAREGLPDVLGLSADGFQAQAKWSPFQNAWIRPDPGLPATHYLEGVVALNAPGVRPGARLDADLHDIAPTVLSLLDLPVPDYMEGRMIDNALDYPLTVRRHHAHHWPLRHLTT